MQKMYTKLLLIITLFIIVEQNTKVKCEEESNQKPDSGEHPAISRLVKMRCTRRFSPGVCVEDVAPVWTFVFLQQNCTERLGCPNRYRTNRFRSYRTCMRRCRALIEMYLQMVMVEDKNSTDSSQGGPDSRNDRDNDLLEGLEEEGTDERNLRLRLAKNQTATPDPHKRITVYLEDLDEAEEDEEYKVVEDTHAIVYKDTNVNEDILVPDVDYVAGEFRSDLDVLHW